ncbi:MAG: hypothetical protein WCP39_07880 [Chlamydiota bacterium]
MLDPNLVFDDKVLNPSEGLGKYYHIQIRNSHKDKLARNCIAYVERITDLKTGVIRQPEFIELKWKGVSTVGVSIPPRNLRCLDALHINYSNPSVAMLGINKFICDFSGYISAYQIAGPGDYRIDYIVFSDNLPKARKSFLLHLGSKMDDVCCMPQKIED